MSGATLKTFILFSLVTALSGCGEKAESASRKNIGFSLCGFETLDKKPFTYLEESMSYIPVTIRFEKDDGDIKINEFYLSSNNAISIFKDRNNNGTLDEEEKATLKEIGKDATTIDWIEDSSEKKEDLTVLNANYMLYAKDGFIDDTIVSFVGNAKATALEPYCYGNEVLSSLSGPSTITLLYDNPEKHIQITQNTSEQGLYKTDFQLVADDSLNILGVENAINNDDGSYSYEGLGGEITIKYSVNINDPYYANSGTVFGEGEYLYKLSLDTHDHNVSDPITISGMNVYSCECGYFNSYELDSTKALDPTEPDLDNPNEMMGNQMFRIEWDVRGIKKGRYKVYVHGSIDESQNDLKWFTIEDGGYSHCPSYLRFGEAEKQPCTEKTFGETFGEGSGWRWTDDYIFDIEIPESLTELSIQSGNNNGHLNEYNMFLRGLLLVPYSEVFSPSDF